MDPTPTELPRRPTFAGRLRNYLLTGLVALAPSAVTLWVLYRLLNWVDKLLGDSLLRFRFAEYRRIPGLGLIATLLILVVIGWAVSLLGRWIGGRSALSMWDHLLTRIPGIGILYGSTKSIGEAFLTGNRGSFKQVVLVPWPLQGTYRIGFIAAPPAPEVRRRLGPDFEVVFVPHSPNPASGFVHYVPRAQIIYLDWPVEEGLKVIVSGGAMQPVGGPPPRAAAPAQEAGGGARP